jgi:MATE family multidrug resistance protein
MPDYQLAGIWGGIGIGLGVTGILLLVQLMVEIRKQRSVGRSAQLAH